METYTEIYNNINLKLIGFSREVFEILPNQIEDVLMRGLDEIRHFEPMNPARKIAAMSALRFIQDVQAVRNLLGQGYIAQAAAIASNTIELSYDLLYIRDDSERADKWDNHTAFDNLWHGTGIKSRIEDGLKAVGVEKSESDRLTKDTMDLYKALCAAKHANPMFAKWIGGVINDENTLVVGPQRYTHKIEISTAVYIIHALLETTDKICRTIIYFHCREVRKDDFLERIEALHKNHRKYIQEALNKLDKQGEASIRIISTPKS